MFSTNPLSKKNLISPHAFRFLLQIVFLSEQDAFQRGFWFPENTVFIKTIQGSYHVSDPQPTGVSLKVTLWREERPVKGLKTQGHRFKRHAADTLRWNPTETLF